MTILTVEEAKFQLEIIREFVRSGLPEKQVQPWPGHSPQQCQLLNALTGIQIATTALKRWQDLAM